jgi:cell division inhibitor SulA/protein ImuA
MSEGLDELLQRHDIWRCNELAKPKSVCVPSGFADLDAHLSGGGWPCGALTEISLPQEGIGELRLFMPALAQISSTGRWLAWVAPPYIPYAPALATAGIALSQVLLIQPKTQRDGLWALEQALRSGSCAAVLAWPKHLDTQTQRRLQLAAEAGRCMGLLFRHEARPQDRSPAALRLRLSCTGQELRVEILKRRGGRPVGPFSLRLEYVAMHSSAPPAPRYQHTGQHH